MKVRFDSPEFDPTTYDFHTDPILIIDNFFTPADRATIINRMRKVDWHDAPPRLTDVLNQSWRGAFVPKEEHSIISAQLFQWPCISKYIGKKADSVTFDKTITSLVQTERKSVYSKEFARPTTTERGKSSEVGGGYWIANANNRGDKVSKKFIAQSTYKAEIQKSSETAEKALSQTIIPGLRFTRKSVKSSAQEEATP